MQANRQATFSLLFFLGSLLVSIVTVPGLLEVSGSSQALYDKEVSMVSQNFHKQVNRLINKNIITGHLHASYKYLAMSIYFNRADSALPGFSKYFRDLSDKELGNADFFMAYLNKRGGYVELRTIEAPTRSHWLDGLDAMYDGLEIQKTLNEKLLHLHSQATKFEDPHMMHIVEDLFLDNKVSTIKEMSDHIAVLERMMGGNAGLAEYIFDKDL